MLPERTLQYIYDLVLASKLSGINLLDGRGKRALDVGCGRGYGLLALKALGYKVYGFDIDEKAIKIVKQMGFKNVTVANLEEGIPWQQHFHLITCFDVLEHVKELDKALKTLLSANFNTLVITVPNINTEFLRLIYLALRRKARISLTRGKGFLIKDPDHINMMSYKQWLRILELSISSNKFHIHSTTYFQACFKNKCAVLKVPHIGSSIMIVITTHCRR